jgi:hypothetical protein
MADDQLREISESALNHLAAELHAGKSNALKNLFDTMSKFRDYSWSNDLLISQQRPTATRLFTKDKWNMLGRSVKEGEKQITILKPVFTKEPDRTQTPRSPGQSATKKDQASHPMEFGPHDLYDIEQTHGMPLPEIAKTTCGPREFVDKLKAFATKQGISLEYDKSISPTQGVSFDGRIRLAPDMKAAEEFSVLARELAHEMLHHGNGKARLPETVLETQADAVAYVVCRGVGLETKSAAANYIHLYNGDKKTLTESLSVIQKTSSKILDHLLPQQHRSPFQEKAGRYLAEMAAQGSGEPGRTHQAGPTSSAQAPDHSDSVSLDR